MQKNPSMRYQSKFMLILIIGLYAIVAKAEAVSGGRKLFLSAGISQYQDSRWPRLSFTSKDAQDMHDYLSKEFTEGSLLSEKTHPAGVTLAVFRQALEQLKNQNKSEDDTILIYVSTHGTLGRSAESGSLKIQKYLIMADSSYDGVAATGLQLSELIEWFKKLKSRRKALVIDACYSGGGKAHLTSSMLNFLSQQKAGVLKEPDDEAMEGTGVYAASAWGEEAREDAALGNGIYTHFLLKAFEEDPNGDGATQLSEAHAVASNWVIDYTKRAQHPSAQVEFIGRDPMIIRGEIRRGARPYLLTMQKDLRKYLIRWNGRPLGDLGKGILELPEGTANLEIEDPDTRKIIARRSVELFEHETYTLESLLFEKKLNQIDLGLSRWQFLSSEARQSISPRVLSARTISYGREGISGTWDGSLSFSSLQPSVSTVRLQETLAQGPAFLYSENQEIKGWKLDLLLLQKHRINFWTPSNQAWIASVNYGAGPSLLLLQRKLLDWTGPEAQTREAMSLGLEARLGLEAFLPIRNLRAGIKSTYGIYSNHFGGNAAAVDLLDLAVHLGFFF